MGKITSFSTLPRRLLKTSSMINPSTGLNFQTISVSALKKQNWWLRGWSWWLYHPLLQNNMFSYSITSIVLCVHTETNIIVTETCIDIYGRCQGKWRSIVDDLMPFYNLLQRDRAEDAENSAQSSTHLLDSADPKSISKSLCSADTFGSKLSIKSSNFWLCFENINGLNVANSSWK